MKEFWSRRIRDAVPYVPGEQPRGRTFIKLNTNECPYPPSPRALEAIRAAANDSLRLYPDPECLELRRTIARRYRLSENQVFVGNGSDEVLAFAFQAFFEEEQEIVFPEVTYSFYPVYTNYFGLRCRRVPMNEDFSDPIDLLCGQNGGVVLANPNAPTGSPWDWERWRRCSEPIRKQWSLWMRPMWTLERKPQCPSLTAIPICWWYRRPLNPEPWPACGWVGPWATPI